MRFIGKLVGRLRGRLGALLVLTVLVGIASPATAAKSTHSKAGAVSHASEIAEQLSENAPKVDAAAFAKSMSDLGALNARLSASLTPDRQKALDTFLAGMRDAWTADDRSALAVQSIEAFRLLQEALPRGPRAVPVQVAQLDYVGFKVNTLLASTSTDWSRIANTVREAQAWWSAIGSCEVHWHFIRGAMWRRLHDNI